MKRTLKLGVNIDHVATLRQARLGKFPSPEYAAKVCEQAGADGITAPCSSFSKISMLPLPINTRLRVFYSAANG